MDAQHAWEEATIAGERAVVTMRSLSSLEDIGAAQRVTVETWGEHGLPPRELLRAMQESRNLLQGAFRGNVLVGFAFGWWGRDEDGWHLHSHMLAVLPGLRSSGIGYALKLAQRAACLDVGVTRIRWTFDPLQSRNAWFNMSKLGAGADAFHRGFYGEMADDLNLGDRSDRMVLRWDLGVGVTAGVGAARLDDAVRVIARGGTDDDAPEGVRGDPPTAGRAALVAIPREFAALRAASPALGQGWRDASADAFERCFAVGLRVVAFTRDSEYVFDV